MARDKKDKMCNVMLNKEHQDIMTEIGKVYGFDQSATMRYCIHRTYEQMVDKGHLPSRHFPKAEKTDFAVKIGNKTIPLISPANRGSD
jgi:hypothetical protein